MGLQRIWVEVAESIGVDAFLKMWRILDSDKSSIEHHGRMIIEMRSYKSYMRYQRNRYIECLHDMGLDIPTIQQKLKEQLCEHVSLRHISRIAKEG
jgi:hypothetical protein